MPVMSRSNLPNWGVLVNAESDFKKSLQIRFPKAVLPGCPWEQGCRLFDIDAGRQGSCRAANQGTRDLARGSAGASPSRDFNLVCNETSIWFVKAKALPTGQGQGAIVRSSSQK